MFTFNDNEIEKVIRLSLALRTKSRKSYREIIKILHDLYKYGTKFDSLIYKVMRLSNFKSRLYKHYYENENCSANTCAIVAKRIMNVMLRATPLIEFGLITQTKMEEIGIEELISAHRELRDNPNFNYSDFDDGELEDANRREELKIISRFAGRLSKAKDLDTATAICIESLVDLYHGRY